MIEGLDLILPTGFGFAAVLYLWLAVRVSRASIGLSNSAISYFLFLMGIMVAGSAFAYNTADANLYGIGSDAAWIVSVARLTAVTAVTASGDTQ